jgi:uracil-DNA glycosylase
METKLTHPGVVFAMKGIRQPWRKVLLSATIRPSLDEALEKLNEEYLNGAETSPSAGNIFAWTAIPPDKVRILVIGQDPYPKVTDAHGLAFSSRALSTPKSLGNVFSCLMKRGLITTWPKSNDLTRWADQGVLLLNTSLTTVAGESDTHPFWKPFTRAVVKWISDNATKPIAVFMWGKHAQQYASSIGSRHKQFMCIHPVIQKFVAECDHFEKANAFLTSIDEKPIVW